MRRKKDVSKNKRNHSESQSDHGQQKRESTAEGKGEFEYLGMDRKDFVDYFTNKNPDVIATAAGEITFKNDQGVESKLRITSKNGKAFIWAHNDHINKREMYYTGSNINGSTKSSITVMEIAQ